MSWDPKPVGTMQGKLAEFKSAIEQFDPARCETNLENIESLKKLRESLSKFKEFYIEVASFNTLEKFIKLEVRAEVYLEEHETRDFWAKRKVSVIHPEEGSIAQKLAIGIQLREKLLAEELEKPSDVSRRTFRVIKH